MSFYNEKNIHDILSQMFSSHKIVDYIQKYLFFLIKVKLPLSINGATINISKILKITEFVNLTYEKNNIIIEMNLLNFNFKPLYINYIGKNEQITVTRDISEKKFKILKDILGYNFNIDIKEYNIDKIKIFLNGMIKYDIIITIPSIDKIPFNKSEQDEDIEFIIVNDKKGYISFEKIKKNICSIESNFNKKIMFEFFRDKKKIYITGNVIN